MARDRRILDVEAAASAWGLRWSRFTFVRLTLGHDGCKMRANISEYLSGPRGSVSGPDGGHRPRKQKVAHNLNRISPLLSLVMALFQVNRLCVVL